MLPIFALVFFTQQVKHIVIRQMNNLTAGINSGMVRFSVGLEDINDILDDLKQAFANVK